MPETNPSENLAYAAICGPIAMPPASARNSFFSFTGLGVTANSDIEIGDSNQVIACPWELFTDSSGKFLFEIWVLKGGKWQKDPSAGDDVYTYPEPLPEKTQKYFAARKGGFTALASKRKVIPFQPGGDTKSTASQNTWTAHLNSLSRYPYPISHALRLNAWCKIPARYGDQPVILAPVATLNGKTGGPTSIKPFGKANTNPADKPSLGRLVANYEFGVIKFDLYIDFQDGPSTVADGEIPFLKISDGASSKFFTALKGSRVNWRKDLPTSIGRAFDLLELAIQQRKLGDYTDAKRTLLLKLAWQRAGLGLRKFANAPADDSKQSKGGHDDKASEPQKPPTTTAEVALRLLATNRITLARRNELISAIRQYPGNDSDKVDVDAFVSDLKEVHRTRGSRLAELQKLLEKVPADLPMAAQELSRFLEDEAVLADLFVLSWKRVLANDPKMGRNLTELTGLDIFEAKLDSPTPVQSDAEKQRAARDQRTAQDRLIAGLRDIHRGLRQWYGDGLAQAYWSIFTGNLAKEHKLISSVTETLQEYGKAWKTSTSGSDAITFASFAGCKDGPLRELLEQWSAATGEEIPARAAATPASTSKDTPENTKFGKSEDKGKYLRTPHPLPITVTLPQSAGDSLQDWMGALVFVRKSKGGDQGYTPWTCLNVATLRHLSVDLEQSWSGVLPGVQTSSASVDNIVADFCLNPSSFSSSFAVPQRLLEYNGRPLRCHLVENGATGSVVHSDDPSDLPTHSFKLAYHQVCNDFYGWQRTFQLTYDPNSEYEFALAGVHHSGWIHPSLRPKGDLTGFAALRPADDLPKISAEYVQSSGAYLRTVPPGKPRLMLATNDNGWPQPNAQSTEELARECALWDWQKLEIPPPPAKVRCVADDLPWQPRGNTRADEFLSTSSAPAVLLLYRDPSGKLSREAVKLRIRPPATSLENWYAWPHKGDKATRAPEIRSVERYLAQKSADQPLGSSNPAADYVDDPAISGIHVEATRLFPLPPRGQVPPSVSQTMPLSSHPESPNSGDWPHSLVQRATAGMLVLNWKRDANDASPRMSPPDKSSNVHFYVAPGEVWELEIYSVIPEEAFKRFQGEILATKMTDTGEHLVSDTVEVFRVEAALAPLESNQAKEQWLKEILPSAETVWKCSSLEANPKTGTLQAYITPDFLKNGEKKTPDVDHWAYVRAVRVELQPWRWNGLPQDGDKLYQWASFENAIADPKSNDKFTDFFRAEIAAYADRGEFDALAYDKDVSFLNPPGDPQDQPGSGVPSLLHQVPPIYEDDGAVSSTPRYFRARFSVYSRYEGLPGFSENSASVQALSPATSDGKRTEFRRAITYGRMRLPPPVPKIKLVIPVFEHTNSGHQTLRPGFLVLSQEPLPSPFQYLKAEISIANVKYLAKEDEGLAESLSEIGTDPILTQEGFQFQQTQPLQLEGKAIGLTFEREANTPLFAHAAFLFEDFATLQIPDGHRDVDYFMKASFYWELRGGTLEPGEDFPPLLEWQPPSSRGLAISRPGYDRVYRSAFTGVWEVRLLGIFDSVIDLNTKKPVPIEKITFQLKGSDLEFQNGSSAVKLTAAVNSEVKDRFTLLFVTWRMVPDFFHTEGRLFCSLHEINQDGNISAIRVNEPAGQPEQGQFLLVLNSPRRPQETGEFKPSGPPEQVPLWRYLFADQIKPDANINSPGDDAMSMLVRCSRPIDRKEVHAKKKSVRLRGSLSIPR